MVQDSGQDEVERAGWLRRSTLHEAACLTLVRGADVERVAAGFGAVADLARPLDIDEFCEESFAQQERYPMIAVRPLGDWLLVVEDGGSQGRRPEVLRRITRGTRGVSLFWDAAAVTRFSSAAAGELRTTFEAVLPEIREGAAPDELEGARAGLPWSRAEPVSLMLALAGRVTGIEPTREWLAGEFRTFPVAPWPDDLASLPAPPSEITGYPPELAPLLRAAGPAERRSAALAVARHVLGSVGFLCHPVVDQVLAAMRGRRGVDHARLNETVREWSWRSVFNRPRGSAVRNELHALEVLRRAAHDDPLTAVLAALAEARRVRGIDPAELAHVASAALDASCRS
ncbi:DUF6461 domain-containing protein [Saccharopolyspora sp. CA-218241]|uniref:DUF6461 domain-containing protein n=1 Tax=Saccharopolyspora sp. CA-218241 TaxID=3240027 RepID=UPI003D97148E